MLKDAFNGLLFISNASFNNLHHAHWATGFNFGRALLGTIPAVYLGARWFGPRPESALAAQSSR